MRVHLCLQSGHSYFGDLLIDCNLPDLFSPNSFFPKLEEKKHSPDQQSNHHCLEPCRLSKRRNNRKRQFISFLIPNTVIIRSHYFEGILARRYIRVADRMICSKLNHFPIKRNELTGVLIFLRVIVIKSCKFERKKILLVRKTQ